MSCASSTASSICSASKTSWQTAGRPWPRETRRSPWTSFNAALALWRGAPLADLAYEAFAGAEIGRLEELRAEAVEDRIAAELGARPRCGAGGGARRAGPAPSPARAPTRRAHARALPLRTTSGRTRGLPERSPGPDRRAWDRAEPRAARAPGSHPAPGFQPRPATGARGGTRVAPQSVRGPRGRAGCARAGSRSHGGRPRSRCPRGRRTRHRQEPARRRADGTSSGSCRARDRRSLLGGGRRPRVLAMGPVAARIR